MDILGRLILVFLTVALVLPVLPEADPEPEKNAKTRLNNIQSQDVWNLKEP